MEQPIHNCVVYSSYYDMDILFQTTNLEDVNNHPVKYDNLATGSREPDYECTNCKSYGFPCFNCALHVYNCNIKPADLTDDEWESKQEWIIRFDEQDKNNK